MSVTPYTSTYDNSFDLVIGIDRYAHASPLEVACEDAKSVAAVLQLDLSFPKENISVLLYGDGTRDRIMATFLAFERLQPNDRLLVFSLGTAQLRMASAARLATLFRSTASSTIRVLSCDGMISPAMLN
jgi:hypothetical protein